jgi:hypothetical protein
MLIHGAIQVHTYRFHYWILRVTHHAFCVYYFKVPLTYAFNILALRYRVLGFTLKFIGISININILNFI